ncbi:MAG TPA: hypothetical protein VGD80_07825 [Kofleriaceae bacterium]
MFWTDGAVGSMPLQQHPHDPPDGALAICVGAAGMEGGVDMGAVEAGDCACATAVCPPPPPPLDALMRPEMLLMMLGAP